MNKKNFLRQIACYAGSQYNRQTVIRKPGFNSVWFNQHLLSPGQWRIYE